MTKDNNPASELTHLVNQLIAAFRSSKTVSHISHVTNFSKTHGASRGLSPVSLSQPPQMPSPSAATIKLPGVVRAAANPKTVVPIIPVHKSKVTTTPASTILGGLSTVVTQARSAVSSPSGGLLGTLGTVVNAITQNGKSSSTSSSAAGGFFSHLLRGGLGLIPLVSGIVGLFSGHHSAPLPLTRFLLPKPVQLDTGLSPSQQIGSIDYSQNGQPRASNPAAQTSQTVASAQQSDKSLLDYSDQIAQAVKQALLYSHSLNDVIADL